MRKPSRSHRGGFLARWASVGLCLTAPACLRVEWSRISNYTPIPEEFSSDLEVGRSDMAACLEQFGSPLWVLEHPIDGRDGALLAWGWYTSTDAGVRISYAFDRFISTSLEYQQTDANMEGIVAIFDADWKLVELKRGLLRDLTAEIPRVRPSVVLPD